MAVVTANVPLSKTEIDLGLDPRDKIGPPDSHDGDMKAELKKLIARYDDGKKSSFRLGKDMLRDKAVEDDMSQLKVDDGPT